MTNKSATNKATLARIWRGWVRRDRADGYQRYWLSQLGRLCEQAVRLDVFRENRAEETEFMSISYWSDLQSMLRSSGHTDPRAVNHLARNAEFLLELPDSVQLRAVIDAEGD